MPGRNGHKVLAVVMHIGEGYRAGFHKQFTAGGLSAHYVVYRDGSIEQWVREEDAAWHAGEVYKPAWAFYEPGVNPNLTTIGIEHEGFTGEPWTEEMIQADLFLLRGIAERHGLVYSVNTLIGHHQLDSVNRRNCPGWGCPWERLFDELTPV